MPGAALVTALVDRLVAPVPAARLGLVRLLVGAYATIWLLGAAPGFVGLVQADPGRFHPVGVFAGFDAPLPPGLAQALLVLAVMAGGAFTAGVGGRLVRAVFAGAFLAVTTYRDSWGQIFHTENLVALHLIVLAIAPSDRAWSLPARRGRRPGEPRAAQAVSGWPLVTMSAITVVSYAVAAVAKLRNSGWDWVTGDTLRNHVARDNLEKALFGDPYSPLARVVLAHAWLFPPLAWATMVVELGAPLALVLRRWRVVWAGLGWVFHVGVLVLMAVFFPYQLSGVAYASFFPVERAPGAIARWWSRRHRRALRSPGAVAASGNN